ncbi:LysR family transcriptional regulator [Chelativorans salis]|uniref:LysR family transcriptional regulator n=1 Tax=Chelativorans salis TaxID=2978478 RepID=UPI003CC5C227
MQDHSWDDLRYLLAVHRAGTLARAARVLGVNETTVARRLRTLEQSLTVKLLVRNASGHYEVTDVAQVLIGHAQVIERENLAIEDAVGRASRKMAGTVRISSVPIVVNRILVPHLPELRDKYPLLTVELVPDSRNVDLTKREADLAVRLARPESKRQGAEDRHARVLRLRPSIRGGPSGLDRI